MRRRRHIECLLSTHCGCRLVRSVGTIDFWGDRMRRKVYYSLVIAAVVLVAGSAYGASKNLWRPAMPEISVQFRPADTSDKPPELMLIYGDDGSDPFRSGTLAADQHVNNCRTVNSLCMSRAGRKEFGLPPIRQQSLQIRLFNGNGNPIIGGVRWTGPAHPSQIVVTCDRRVSDVRKSCAVLRVTA